MIARAACARAVGISSKLISVRALDDIGGGCEGCSV